MEQWQGLTFVGEISVIVDVPRLLEMRLESKNIEGIQNILKRQLANESLKSEVFMLFSTKFAWVLIASGSLAFWWYLLYTLRATSLCQLIILGTIP